MRGSLTTTSSAWSSCPRSQSSSSPRCAVGGLAHLLPGGRARVVERDAAARPGSASGSRPPSAARRTRAGSCRRPAPRAAGCGSRAGRGCPDSRLVPLRPTPTTSTRCFIASPHDAPHDALGGAAVVERAEALAERRPLRVGRGRRSAVAATSSCVRATGPGGAASRSKYTPRRARYSSQSGAWMTIGRSSTA